MRRVTTWDPAAWLIQTKAELPAASQAQLRAGLYGSLFIFFGGVLNSIAVATIAVCRHSGAEFRAWLVLELALGLLRLPLLAWNRRALRRDRQPLERLTVVLSCAWAGSVGFGAFISITSGDWILASIVCLSTAAMVCGICLRNFGAPRLAALMVILALTPCAVAGLFTAEHVVRIISVQLPIYMVAIFASSFALHEMLVSKMKIVSSLEESQAFNRTILQASPDFTLVLDPEHRIEFYNYPNARPNEGTVLPRAKWLDLLPEEDKAEGARVLAGAAAGQAGTMVTSSIDAAGRKRWFHTAVSGVGDGSGRTIIVSRDISEQKSTEQNALWMAQHDILTGLPNRSVLQSRLDALVGGGDGGAGWGLLILDVDKFKAINDTLGHDAGDALLGAFADRLRTAVAGAELVTRTGGDEFALLVQAGSNAELERTCERIYAALEDPFVHDGRLLDCNGSIGAALLPRDGATRSEILKSADIALYAAKASGRGRLEIFQPRMRVQVLARDDMISCARMVIAEDRVVPYFQPKVCLRTHAIIGFEALLRWRDASGAVRGPEELRAAFEDPAMGAALSDQMIKKTVRQMQLWSAAGVAFDHVAVNTTSADFRRKSFAQDLIARLAAAKLSASALQIEVTESVFVGRGAAYVDDALTLLSQHGIRVALDDFGTGFASLSHLNQFPVDILKIDRSFTESLGKTSEASAITAAIVNLGHCLGMQIVAEGVETAAQETQLAVLGCDLAQGFLYSPAIAAECVPLALEHSKRRAVAVA